MLGRLMDIPPPNSDDYSVAATLIPFDHPLPLLRGPIEAGPADDPSSGSHLLAFNNPRAWAAAYANCKATIISQCEAGSRIGCSISASSKCNPPWWKILLGISSKQDFTARAKCEEIEMEACFAVAKEKCGEFAVGKILSPFKDARVSVKGLESQFVNWKEVFGLISGLCFSDEKRYGNRVWGVDKSWDEFRCRYVVTNVRGRDLMDSDDMEH